jgi:Cu/Ag efflux pump CusA
MRVLRLNPRSVFDERAESGYYLEIDIDLVAASRYGLNVGGPDCRALGVRTAG